ncbi:MAG TPA: hypothetical protein VKC56_13140, partial [Gallionellaceae bacterium]|nr:hypothetical protein [Gallionellaceae bacterium]
WARGREVPCTRPVRSVPPPYKSAAVMGITVTDITGAKATATGAIIVTATIAAIITASAAAGVMTGAMTEA